jgi:hypothetical protein
MQGENIAGGCRQLRNELELHNLYSALNNVRANILMKMDVWVMYSGRKITASFFTFRS